MIVVNWTKNKIEITGHALSGEPGKDLVCAAVSAIATGALNALDSLAPNDYDLILKDDSDPLISIESINENVKGEIILETLLIQLKTVQNSYPKYLDIRR